jgi:predicted metalloprotease with PDZ domain
LLTRYEDGRLVLSKVVLDSPADKAGFVPGDEIVQVNGRLPGLFMQCDGIRAHDNRNLVLTLKRGSAKWDVRLTLVPIRELIETAWDSRRATQLFLPVGGQPTVDRRDRAVASLGFSWEERSSLSFITDVLPNSPADVAGLQTGDQIVAFNHSAAGEFNGERFSSEPGSTLVLTIFRDQKARDIKLTDSGISQILLWLPRRMESQPSVLKSSLK